MKLRYFLSLILITISLCLFSHWTPWQSNLRQNLGAIAALPPRLNQQTPKSQPIDGAKLQKALDQHDFTDAVRQVELGWKFQYETYYDGKLKSQYLELLDMQRRMSNIDRSTRTRSALLYAIPRPKGLHLILVPAQGAAVHKNIVAADAKALAEVVKAFRLNVVNVESTREEYLPPAQKLYSWLIEPVASEIRSNQIDTLVFCLGTGLRGLPLAALHDGQNFLAETYNLAIIPAFNLLDHRPTVLSGLQILAMGASKFQSQQPLPAVPLELDTITHGESWPGQVFLNESFTVEQFQAARSKTPYGIVHLATHADISSKSVTDSYIQFWDRRLQLNQLRDLRLEMPVVQLLVLSACRTALGTPNAELGFAGLAIQSGAKSVLASLWAVDDVGTLVLMSEFYRQLKTAPIKSTALRQTQIAMLRGQLKLGNSPAVRRSAKALPEDLKPLKTADLSHPYYWAAFAMVGNPW
jgi:CHAT domain-containing protein